MQWRAGWMSIGGEPFFVTGGVVTSYILVNGMDGTAIAAGLVPIHGGYVRAPAVAAYINGPSDDMPGAHR